MKKRVLGLAGRMGNGKNFVGEIAEGFADTWGVGSAEIALADEVKRIARTMFPGIEVEQLWGPSERRNEPVPPGNLYRADGELLTIRHVLQQIGTDLGRNLYPDIWVNKVLESVRRLEIGFNTYSRVAGIQVLPEDYRGTFSPKTCLVVVPDVRFPNEVEAIRKAGGKVWWVEGGKVSEGFANHASEQSLGRDECDWTIHHSFEGREAMMDLIEPLLSSFLGGKSRGVLCSKRFEMGGLW